MNYAAEAAGLDKGYLNTTVDFGTTDVAPIVLGIKNSGTDAIYLPLDSATNIAVIQGLQQNNVPMKASISATGYGQALLDQPASKTLTDHDMFQTAYKPVELGGKDIKTFQQNLKKYAGYTGVPGFGEYTGYVSCDLAIVGLRPPARTRPRQGWVDGIRTTNGGIYDNAGLTCGPRELQQGELRQGGQRQLHLLHRREGREVESPLRRQARKGQDRRRSGPDQAVREQRRHRRDDHVGGSCDVARQLVRPAVGSPAVQAGRVFEGESREVPALAPLGEQIAVAEVVAEPAAIRARVGSSSTMLPSSSKSIREPGVHGTPPGGAALAMEAVMTCRTQSASASSVTSNVVDAVGIERGDHLGDELGADLGEQRVVHGDDGLLAGTRHQEQVREPGGHQSEQRGGAVGPLLGDVRPPRPMISCPARRGSGVTSGSKPVA